MTEIAFPTVPLQEFRLTPVTPNVIRHNSIYTAKEQIFSRGNLYFRGRIGWARRALDRFEEVSEIEAFITECYGPLRTFKVPIPRDQTERFGDADDAAAITISAVTTDGTFESSFSATKGLLRGDYVNFGDRLHKIVSAVDTAYKCVPGILGSETSMKWHSPYLHARATQDSLDLPREGVYSGPWRIEIQEVLDD